MSKLDDIKARIRAGRKPEPVVIAGVGDTLMLRPLTGDEWVTYDEIALAGQRFRGFEVEVAPAVSARAMWDADRYLVRTAVVDDEPWTDDDLAEFDREQVTEIADAVRARRPTKEDADLAARFRNLTGRAGDPAAAPAGSAPGGQPS